MVAQPRLSICIPTYNRANLLKRCLISVCASSSLDIEILVADNASPDKTQEVLQAIMDPRLQHWRHPNNIGAERNMLFLLEAARGEWILCLTDDDFLLPRALERLDEVLQSVPEIGVLLSNLRVVDLQENDLWKYRHHHCTQQLMPGQEALSIMFQASHILSGIIVRRFWLDLVGMKRHLDSMYPQMYLVGAIVRDHPGYYLDECLIAHTQGNVTFWNYPEDFMVKLRIQMIKDILPEKKWRSERAILIDQTIKEIGQHHLSMSWSKGFKHWCKHQLAILSIREVALSIGYWSSIVIFFGKIFKNKFLISFKQ